MVGYSTSSPEWIILNPRSGKLRTAHSVTFDEGVPGLIPQCQNGIRGSGDVVTTPDPAIYPPVISETSYSPPNMQNSQRGKAVNEDEPTETANGTESVSDENYSSEMQESEDSEESEYEELSTDETENDNSHLKPIVDQLQSIGLCMALNMNPAEDVPKSWRLAMNTPHWREAMEREKSELEGMDAWELVRRPSGIPVLPGIWRFRVNRDEHGEVARFKARWCVDGSRDNLFRQPESTYSPVAEHTTVRCLFALAAALEQPVLQADFPNAYLNAEIGENMYMKQTTGLEHKGK